MKQKMTGREYLSDSSIDIQMALDAPERGRRRALAEARGRLTAPSSGPRGSTHARRHGNGATHVTQTRTARHRRRHDAEAAATRYKRILLLNSPKRLYCEDMQYFTAIYQSFNWHYLSMIMTSHMPIVYLNERRLLT